MTDYATDTTDLRLLLPESFWLEPDHYQLAKEVSDRFNNETQQWQVYLNTLAVLGFEAWLKERFPSHYPIHHHFQEVVNTSYVSIGEFKLCAIATEHVLDEVVRVPRSTIEQQNLAAHFYVVFEIVEEEEQAIIRGFCQYSELLNQIGSSVSSQTDDSYCLPLSVLDTEINHLITYVQYLEPTTIDVPFGQIQVPEVSLELNFNGGRTRLSQWLQGVLDEGWQAIDALINPEENLAWSTRHTLSGVQGGKLINFGMQLGNQSVALLVTVTPDSEGKVGINIQILPVAGAQVLPPQLKLTLLSTADKILQEVDSREHDNYIQLKPFKGRTGTGFSIEVSLNNIRVREAFEL